MVLRRRICWACAIAVFVIALVSTLPSLIVHINSGRRAHSPQQDFGDGSSKKDGQVLIQVWSPPVQAFKWLEHRIPTQDIKAALLEMFRLETAGAPQSSVTETSKSLRALDASAIAAQIRAGINAFTDEELHFVFCGRDSSIYFTDGWRCDENHSTFYKIFTIGGRRKYKLQGRFLESPKGRWRAEGTRLVRLVTLEERARLKGPDTDPATELIPTAEEARIALVNWWETEGLVGWMADRFSPREVPDRRPATERNLLSDKVERVMGSRETRDMLANGRILPQQNLLVVRGNIGAATANIFNLEPIHFDHFEIDGWEVYVDDLVFVRTVPLIRVGNVSHVLEGGFVLTRDGRWQAKPVYFRPTMK